MQRVFSRAKVILCAVFIVVFALPCAALPRERLEAKYAYATFEFHATHKTKLHTIAFAVLRH
jgi:hypothetical protein